jgi:hypothetical protein
VGEPNAKGPSEPLTVTEDKTITEKKIHKDLDRSKETERPATGT